MVQRLQGILFDCDGVLAETERDGHRVAFNETFAAAGLATRWSVERYGTLLQTAGGKERMRRHFDEAGWPDPAALGCTDRDALVAELHRRKTERFLEMVEGGELALRPGVARLIDAARAAGVRVAVCSTSSARAVRGLVEALLGPARAADLPVFAGDAVPAKKPDPAVYTLALEQLGLEPGRSVAVEDSANGLAAARAAELACLITPSAYTLEEDFGTADRVVRDLDDGPVTLETLDALLRA
jgi:HAD superfamily hydrolase (TIGR01509 family)